MEIDPSRRVRTSSSDDIHGAEQTRHNPDAQPEIRHAHETLLDGNAKLYAQNVTRSNVTGAAPTFNDGILYVGMNASVAGGVAQNVREERNLGTLGVETIQHGEDLAGVGEDCIRANGRVWDLTTDQGRAGFVATLGLPDVQAKKVADVLMGTPNDRGGRDELAGIATVWARAEHGGTIPSRLVLSGHCYGTSVWDGNRGGTKNDGELSFATIQKLADAMPRAAAQVEDVMISACNSGHENGTGTKPSAWQQHFPNLKTVWAYSADDSHSPTEAHAVSHIAAWRAATAGRTTHVDGEGAVRAEYRREGVAAFAAENVAIWSSTDGYRHGGRP